MISIWIQKIKIDFKICENLDLSFGPERKKYFRYIGPYNHEKNKKNGKISSDLLIMDWEETVTPSQWRSRELYVRTKQRKCE